MWVVPPILHPLWHQGMMGFILDLVHTTLLRWCPPVSKQHLIPMGKGLCAPGFPSNTLGATVLSTAALPFDPAKSPCEFEIQRRDPDVSLLNWRPFVSQADFGHNISSLGSVFARRFCSSLSRRCLGVQLVIRDFQVHVAIRHVSVDYFKFNLRFDTFPSIIGSSTCASTLTTLRFTCFIDIWSSLASQCWADFHYNLENYLWLIVIVLQMHPPLLY